MGLRNYWRQHTWPVLFLCYTIAAIPYLFFSTIWYTREAFTPYIGFYLLAVPMLIAMVPGIALLTLPQARKSELTSLLLLPFVSSLGLYFWLAVSVPLICFVMVILPFVGVTTLMLYCFVLLRGFYRGRIYSLGLFFAMPALITVTDLNSEVSDEYDTVVTTIEVKAPPTEVWQQLVEVSPIQPQELRPHLIHLLNIPRPVSSQLSSPGVGGVRTITWEKGLQFEEHLSSWSPPDRMDYTIQKKEQIPQHLIDQHIRIGGRYFDVLKGSYQLEEVHAGDTPHTRVHLSVDYRLSSTQTWYAHFWARFVLNDLQESILEVIQRRSESLAKPRSF